jgi:hypothetical protein
LGKNWATLSTCHCESPYNALKGSDEYSIKKINQTPLWAIGRLVAAFYSFMGRQFFQPSAGALGSSTNPRAFRIVSIMSFSPDCVLNSLSRLPRLLKCGEAAMSSPPLVGIYPYYKYFNSICKQYFQDVYFPY